jgi:hypothetical protein
VDNGSGTQRREVIARFQAEISVFWLIAAARAARNDRKYFQF